MDKIKKIKILSAVSIIGTILAITVAFALITRSMVINGSGNVKPALWDIHFKDISEPTITGGASVINSPTVADKGAKIDNLEVKLSLPQDKIEYTVYIENSGDMNAKIDDIKYPTLTEEESKIFKFSAKYEKDGSPMQVGDTLYKGQTKKVIITIEYLDISDKNLLPKEAKTIDIDFKIKYVQDNNSYADEISSPLPDGYKECKYLESTRTQYIDLGIKYTKYDYIYYIDSQSTSISKEQATFGAAGLVEYYSTPSRNNYASVFTNKATQTDILITDRNIFEFCMNKKIARINGINYEYSNHKPGISYSAYLFNYHNNNSNYFANARIYKFKIYDYDYNLILDFIPALDNNNKPCMYDTVSGVTFYNEGTGEFNYQLK